MDEVVADVVAEVVGATDWATDLCFLSELHPGATANSSANEPRVNTVLACLERMETSHLSSGLAPILTEPTLT